MRIELTPIETGLTAKVIGLGDGGVTSGATVKVWVAEVAVAGVGEALSVTVA
jgi:hypothetical protein